jgi:predicted phosphoribosyltransferase
MEGTSKIVRVRPVAPSNVYRFTDHDFVRVVCAQTADGFELDLGHFDRLSCICVDEESDLFRGEGVQVIRWRTWQLLVKYVGKAGV